MTSKFVQLGFIGDLGIPGRLGLVACLPEIDTKYTWSGIDAEDQQSYR